MNQFLESKIRRVDENYISSKIKILDDNFIEYEKKGYHKPIKTNRPLSSVRLELAIDESGLTQGEVTQLANQGVNDNSKITQSTISRIIGGKVKKTTYFPILAKTLGVNTAWLAGLEENDVLGIKFEENEVHILNERFILVCIYDKTHHDDANRNNANHKGESKIMVAANLIDDTVNKNDLRFIYEQDRANAPDIKPGAAVTFNTGDTEITNGDFFVIQHGANRECVRTLYLEPNGDIRIRAKQADFPEYIVKPSDNHFNILGRVLAVTNRY